LAMTAGAVVSGAFFGDKMSPLSDTTNMSSSILQVDLFAHIKNMTWTTIPAFIISFILFAVLSPSISASTFAAMEQFQSELLSTGLVTWGASMIPILVLIVFSIKKSPALLALAASSLTALIVAIFLKNAPLGKLMGIIFRGYESVTGFEDIDELLSRGGMES